MQSKGLSRVFSNTTVQKHDYRPLSPEKLAIQKENESTDPSCLQKRQDFRFKDVLKVFYAFLWENGNLPQYIKLTVSSTLD